MEKYEEDTAWLRKNLSHPTEREIDEFIQQVSLLMEDLQFNELFARNYCCSVLARNRQSLKRVNGHG